MTPDQAVLAAFYPDKRLTLPDLVGALPDLARPDLAAAFLRLRKVGNIRPVMISRQRAELTDEMVERGKRYLVGDRVFLRYLEEDKPPQELPGNTYELTRTGKV